MREAYVQCPFLSEPTVLYEPASSRANCASARNNRCRAQAIELGTLVSKSSSLNDVRCALACSIAEQMLRTEREGADD